MSPWPVVIIPLSAGLFLLGAPVLSGRAPGGRTARSAQRGYPARSALGSEPAIRWRLGAAAVSVVVLTAGLAALVTLDGGASSIAWAPQLTLQARLTPLVGAMAMLVPVIAAPVLAWAAAHEDGSSLRRLLGLLLVFVGSMELLVIAADLLTLIIGWELVGALSWALIAHHHQDPKAAAGATYAYDATRLGGLGLLLAAGACYAATGSFAFDDLVALDPAARSLVAGGVLFAAVSKSAQVPFSPWLFRAMEGPTSVSALLHASTMVAAGAWILIRLQPELQGVTWFGPVAIAVGLATSVAGGAVALTESHGKRVLAASTSAQYGLMFAAAGAGATGAAFSHLVAHAVYKALLFLVVGTAMHAAKSAQLDAMKLGLRRPLLAAASAVGALALAGLPPLGAGFTKEQIFAGLGAVSPALAVVGIAAGALSAAYAARFHLLAFARAQDDDRSVPAPSRGEQLPILGLAAVSLGLGVLWWPSARAAAASALGVTWPGGHAWEVALSVVTALAAVQGVRVALRSDRRPRALRVSSWLGLSGGIDRALVHPLSGFAVAAAQFDAGPVETGTRAIGQAARRAAAALTRLLERGLSAAVKTTALAFSYAARRSRTLDDEGVAGIARALARGVMGAGDDARRLQDGAVPTYYGILTVGALALLLLLFVVR